MRTIEIVLSTKKSDITLQPKLCRRITTSTQLILLREVLTHIMTRDGLHLVKVILRAIRTDTTKLQIWFIVLNVVVSLFLLSAWLKLHAGEMSWHMSFETDGLESVVRKKKKKTRFILLNVVVSLFLLSVWLKLHAGERSWHMSFEIHIFLHTHTTHSQNSVLYILVNYGYI